MRTFLLGGISIFNDIGVKIQTLGKVVCWLGIIASIIYGGITIFSAITMQVWINILTGVTIILVGGIASWLSSFFLIGFGKLIENTDDIVNYFYKK